MDLYEVMHAAFIDEMTKIAGELHGATRIGRRPIGVERYLERETESEVTPSEVVEDSVKLSAVSPQAAKAIGLMGAGAGTYHVSRQAHRDWQTGRVIRRQQQLGGM